MEPVKHVISIKDFSYEELYEGILPGCIQMVHNIHQAKLLDTQWRHINNKVTYLFTEPSTRTKGSYWEAGRLLAMDRYIIDGEEATSLTKKESLAETARMLQIYNTDVLVMRSKIEGAHRHIADMLTQESMPMAVHNAGDGSHEHPTQTILDLLTINQEVAPLNKETRLTIGFVGDLRYGRTVHSLLYALHHLPHVRVVFVSPPEARIQEHYKQLFTDRYTESDELAALCMCDVIYVTRIQAERFENIIELQRMSSALSITSSFLNTCKDGIKLMHPKPIDQTKGEIAVDAYNDPRNISNKQVWYGMPSRMYLMQQSIQNLNAITNIEPPDISELKITTSMPLRDYFAQRAKKNHNGHRHFRPTEHGLVIDHIPVGHGYILRSFIREWGICADCVFQVTENVPSERMGRKDIILIEHDFLRPELMVRLRSFDPGITFNIAKDDTFTKAIIPNPPTIVSHIGRCQNKWCINNHDIEAVTKFRIPQEGVYSCYYCGLTHTAQEIV